MPRLVVVVLLALSASGLACNQGGRPLAPGVPAPPAVRYGVNSEAGGTFTHDGVTLITQHIPNGQLAIFPNATHMIPFDDPGTFNGTVERFLRTPFVKRDRIGDAFKSFEKLRSLAAAPGR